MARQSSQVPLAIWLADPSVACWAITEKQTQRLRQALPQAEIIVCPTAEDFCAALPRARVAMSLAFEAAWLKLAPKLEWIASPAAGRDYSQATRPGLERTYGTFHGRIMGETVAAMVLAVNRGLLATQQAQAAGKLWPRDVLSGIMRTLDGTHAVILGFGNIGTWVGRYLKPFGVRVTGVRRQPHAAARPDYFDAADRVVSMDRLDDLLPAADHLILVLPGTASTDGVIDSRRLGLLPPTASIYNVGRGNVLDEAALAEALTKGHLRAAGLDVFKEEPLSATHPLRSAPNTLILPHASAIAPEYLDLYLDEFIPLFHKKFPAPKEA